MARKHKLTLKKIMAAVEADCYLGFSPPAARKLTAASPTCGTGTARSAECGEDKVFGAEELLMMGAC